MNSVEKSRDYVVSLGRLTNLHTCTLIFFERHLTFLKWSWFICLSVRFKLSQFSKCAAKQLQRQYLYEVVKRANFGLKEQKKHDVVSLFDKRVLTIYTESIKLCPMVI